MPDLAEIARRAGVTEAQARAVLDAAGADERVAREPVSRPDPPSFADAATWAAAAVVLGSVAVFMVIENGFEDDPGDKGAVLAVALLGGAGAVLTGRLARIGGTTSASKPRSPLPLPSCPSCCGP